MPEAPPTGGELDETPGSLFGDAETNAAVEQAAVNLVRKQRESDGWEVRSVEREQCGYDLDCRRNGREQHLEVKGTRKEPTQFVMTAGELRRAYEDSALVLVVVGHTLSDTPTVEEWRGRSFEDVFQLAPLRYLASRSGT
jgi:hypothetical protein